MSYSDSDSDEPTPVYRIKPVHADTRIYEHIPSRRDVINGGKITSRTTLVNIAPPTSELVKNLSGIAQPAVPGRLEIDGKLFPKEPQHVVDNSCGYRLRITYNKLILAPVVRIECHFTDRTGTARVPYHVLIVEHHFNTIADGSNTVCGLKMTHKIADDKLTYTAHGATCSGFNNIEKFNSRFGPEEDEVVAVLRSMLSPREAQSIIFHLKEASLDLGSRDQLRQIRSRLPGGSGIMLPSMGTPEYQAFRTASRTFAFDRKHLLTIEDTVMGACKDPLVPLACDDTFSTVDEAVVQLRQSAMIMDAESREQLRLWATPKHKGTLYMTADFAVLAVNFRDFEKLNSGTGEGNFKLPNDLECEMSFRPAKPPTSERRVAGHLLASNPGLPHHDAFFRIAGTKKVHIKLWKKLAYTATDTNARWEEVKLIPHYNSFTYSSQLATVSQLYLSKNAHWHKILKNQRHDLIEEVDATANTKVSPDVQEEAYQWLVNCKPWNEEQLAVIRGVKKTKGKMSVIMGPAGTGKTTLHKALTLYFWILGFHVLSLAPANSNANQVANGMSLDDLRREFPGFDFAKFSFLRLFPGSKDLSADKAKNTANKKVGHAGGNVLPFTELKFGIDEFESVQGTARQFSVIHTIIKTADSGSKKLPLKNGHDAWKVLKEFIDLYRANTIMTVEDEKKYEECFRVCKRKIIGENRFMITTTGNVRSGEMLESWFQAEYGPKVGVVVFIDEAAKDFEVNVWSGIVCEAWADSVQGVWLFGDEMQLRPTNTSLRGKKRQFNAFIDRLDIALPCRLIREGFPFVKLKEQRRMHPCLSDFPNRKVYNGELRDAPGMERPLDDVKPGLRKVLTDIIADHGEMSPEERERFRSTAKDEDARLHWIEVAGIRIEHPTGTSKCVKNHIKVFFDKIMPALLAFYRGREEKMVDEVMIICAYGWTVKLYEEGLKALLEKEKALRRCDLPKLSELARHLTVDSSQGQESLMVIFDGSFQDGDNIGFMEDPARGNVAITRAKEVFWIIGGAMKLRNKSKDSLLVQYKRELEAAGKVHKFAATVPATAPSMDATVSDSTSPVATSVPIRPASAPQQASRTSTCNI